MFPANPGAFRRFISSIYTLHSIESQVCYPIQFSENKKFRLKHFCSSQTRVCPYMFLRTFLLLSLGSSTQDLTYIYIHTVTVRITSHEKLHSSREALIPHKRLSSHINCTVQLSTLSEDTPTHSQAGRTQMRPLPWLLPLLEVMLCGVYWSSEVKVSPEASQASTSCRRASRASILALRSRSH